MLWCAREMLIPGAWGRGFDISQLLQFLHKLVSLLAEPSCSKINRQRRLDAPFRSCLSWFSRSLARSGELFWSESAQPGRDDMAQQVDLSYFSSQSDLNERSVYVYALFLPTIKVGRAPNLTLLGALPLTSLIFFLAKKDSLVCSLGDTFSIWKQNLLCCPVDVKMGVVLRCVCLQCSTLCPLSSVC
jgi:hypothetical protein